ncbi:uncharacterized protein TNCV_4122581 [Trichonephila clavipes]|nr:uncharacterized protein TNCV_4122581 [Trichonephila clavipes]
MAGVSPLLSIGWGHLSLVSPKRHWRVYPLDSRPDAVVLYYGCTPGKHRAWYLPDDWHTASLVGLRGGGRHVRTKLCFALMDPMLLCPGKGIVLPTNPTIEEIAKNTRFFLLSLPNNKMSCKSPFAIFKALQAIGNRNQLKNDICRGVISEPDLLYTSEAKILEGVSDQGAVQILFPLFLTIYLPLLHLPHPHSTYPELQTTTSTSNAIPATSQDAKETSKPRRRKRPPKNTSNTIKPKIVIKMVPHKPRKSASIEYRTDDKDMIVYDVEYHIAPNPNSAINISGVSYKGVLVRKPNHTFIRYDFENPIRKEC